MRIVFMGSGEFGVLSLRWLRGAGHELLEVVTQPARPAGRGKKVAPTPIARAAGELALPLRQCLDVNEPEFVHHIGQLRPEVLLVIAFGQKIGANLLRLPG